LGSSVFIAKNKQYERTKKSCLMGYYSMVSKEKSPLISVITVVYNAEKHIEGCIQSVAQQTYQNIEYIVVDGGSKDRTLDIVKQYLPHIHKWTSEPDTGISNAMNKAIAQASGDYLVFLHADDYFESNEAVEKALASIDDDTDVILADILFGKNLKRQISQGFNIRMNFKTGVFHQGCFCSKALFAEIGNFDENLKIAMDYDFFLRAYRKGVKFQFSGTILSVMRDTGVSSQQDWPTLSRRFNEEKFVHKKNCDSPYKTIIYAFYWALYMPYRKFKQLM
jgi:glycosyltransferase involved in cell wall biosynthesis